MPRLTVTLSDQLYRALKETSARRDVPMRQIIEESLEEAGIKGEEGARALVAAARRRSGLDESEATEVAVEATKDRRDS